MSDDHRNRLSVYIAFAEPGGEVIEVASSLLGAGTAVVLHAVTKCGVTTLTLGDGRPFEIDLITDPIPIDDGIWIYPDDSDDPIARIERRFLAP